MVIFNRYGRCDYGNLTLQAQRADPWYHHRGLLFCATCLCQSMQRMLEKTSRSMPSYEYFVLDSIFAVMIATINKSGNRIPDGKMMKDHLYPCISLIPWLITQQFLLSHAFIIHHIYFHKS